MPWKVLCEQVEKVKFKQERKMDMLGSHATFTQKRKKNNKERKEKCSF